MKDYYYILGIDYNTSENEIKKAYRKLSIKFHPDKNNGDKFFENRFKEIQEAYEVLSNKNKRIIYDSKFRKQNYQGGSKKTKSETKKEGEIISFDASKMNISNDDEITLFWATKNISKVKLSCFKEFSPPTGKKTLTIKAPKTKLLTITLKAIDINGKVLEKSITLNYYKKTQTDPNNNSLDINPIPPKRKPKGATLKPLLLFLFLIFSVILIIVISYYFEKKDSSANLPFISELPPGENYTVEPINEEKYYTLFKEPSDKSLTLGKILYTKNENILFSNFAYVTVKSGELKLIDISGVHRARKLNVDKFLSRDQYYNSNSTWGELSFSKKDKIEYLQYRAEGNCLISVNSIIYEVDWCGFLPNATSQANEPLKVVSMPIIEEWVLVENKEGIHGWIHID